jgi:hypothetical protein
MNILKVQLTAENIRGMNSNPISAIPAPGTNKAHFVHGIACKLNFNSVAFDNAISMVVSNDPNNVSLSKGYCKVSNLPNSASSIARGYNEFSTTSGEQIIPNSPLYLMTEGDSTVGDSTIDVYIIYSVIDL